MLILHKLFILALLKDYIKTGIPSILINFSVIIEFLKLNKHLFKMKSIQNNPNETYKKILDEILINADFENKEIWFMDIYNYLEKIDKKNIMPLILKDLKKLGLEIILNKTYSEFKNFTVPK